MSIFDIIHRAQQQCDAIFKSTTGISPRQYSVLLRIEMEPGLMQTDIVKRTGIDRSTVAELLARLERAGWVDRLEGDDRRAKTLYLTLEGRAVLEAARVPATAAEAEIAGILGKKLGPALAALQKIGSWQPEAVR